MKSYSVYTPAQSRANYYAVYRAILRPYLARYALYANAGVVFVDIIRQLYARPHYHRERNAFRPALASARALRADIDFLWLFVPLLFVFFFFHDPWHATNVRT